MIVLSDTSPINYLCQLGRIDLLPTLFDRIIIPPAVAQELSSPNAPQSVQRFLIDRVSWLEIRVPRSVDHSLDDQGPGEQEAIALAEELQADLLIIDDGTARRIAQRKGLTTTGLLGVILLASERRLIDFATVLEDLLKCGFYVSDDVIERAKKIASELP